MNFTVGPKLILISYLFLEHNINDVEHLKPDVDRSKIVNRYRYNKIPVPQALREGPPNDPLEEVPPRVEVPPPVEAPPPVEVPQAVDEGGENEEAIDPLARGNEEENHLAPHVDNHQDNVDWGEIVGQGYMELQGTIHSFQYF